MNAADMNRLLRRVSWVRLGLAALLLGLTPLIPRMLMPPDNVGILALALLGIAASAGAVLLIGGLTQPHRVAWLGCLLDVALVTAVVAASGGPRSIFTFLYVLAICAACLLLSRVGALAVAAGASALYAGLVFGRVVFPIAYFLEVPDETTALEVLTIFLNAGTLLIIAIVLGGLAQKSRTAQRQLETKQRDLQNLQAFRDVIFHSVSTGLIALDRGHKLTALNRAAEIICGRNAGDAIGRPWVELFGPAIPLGVVEAEIAVSPAAPARYETMFTRPNGTAVPVLITFSALRSGEGDPLGLIAACEDLSEMRKMEARMRQADRLATLGRMAANIAHEIRNPLASLTGAIEALTGTAPVEDERDRLASIVMRESDRLNDILRGFLEYARPAPLSPEMVNLTEILDDVLLLLEHRATTADIKLVRDYTTTLMWSVDPQQFRQAMWNLCLNAIEAMPDGGELRVSASVHGNRLEVCLADTGEGIPASDLSHVFEPFFSTKPDGTGLGLAMVHRIIRDHGGDIEVRSAPGFGSTFTINLPVHHA